jgi:hypothetical protein
MIFFSGGEQINNVPGIIVKKNTNIIPLRGMISINLIDTDDPW